MSTLRIDLRAALRRFAAAPGFACLAVAMLGVGIGATTTVYSIADAVLFRPLPYRDPGQLVQLWTIQPSGAPTFSIPLQQLDVWRQQRDIFEALDGFVRRSFVLGGDGAPERVDGVLVGVDLMPRLGVPPLLGRARLSDDATGGGPDQAILGERLWRRRYGAAPDIIGQRIMLDDRAYTVAGVMPATFRFPTSGPEVWVPLPQPAPDGPLPRVQVIARLTRGVSREAAQARADALVETWGIGGDTGPWRIQLRPPLARQLGEPARYPLYVLLAAAAALVLIACANVANLLIVENTGRRLELAVRAALGATPARLAGEALTSSALLGCTGGVMGILLAHAGTGAIGSILPRDLTFINPEEIRLDGRVLAFACGVTLLSVIAVSLWPARCITREGQQQPGQAADRTRTSLAQHVHGREAFVALQIAMSLVVLVAGGLFARTLLTLVRTDPGFDTRHLVAIEVSLPLWKYPTVESRLAQFAVLRDAIAGVPGVRGTSVATGLPPLVAFDSGLRFEVEGRGGVMDDPALILPLNEVDPAFFAVSGIPLLEGRVFTGEDARTAPDVVILGESMARRLWPDDSPIGRRLRWSPSGLPAGGSAGEAMGYPWRTVVGVAGDVFQHDVAPGEVPLAAYVPLAQTPTAMTGALLVVRTIGTPAPIIEMIRERIQTVDPDQPTGRVATADARYAAFFSRQRFNAALMALFAGVGLLMAAAGLYGVVAVSTAHRTREFAIRMAVGAKSADIVALVLRQGARPFLLGSTVGIAVSLVSLRAIESLLVGVPAKDPWTYAGVVLVLALTATIACVGPARHAARVDRASQLRSERGH